MFTSLRQVARTCPNATLSTRPSTNHGSIAAFTTRSRSHQRRLSSSKPPIPPNNGSPPIPTASVKQVGAPRSDKQPSTESRLAKRKVTKSEKSETVKLQDEHFNEWTRTLPSVPSTQHINPKDVYVASFFSTHRPMSISGPLPPETKAEDIDKIFQVRPKHLRRRTQDVIYTISSAVQNLDEQVANQQQNTQHDDGVSQRVEIIKALTSQNNTATPSNDANTVHVDGQFQNTTSIRIGGNFKLVAQALARQFRPFNPPPAPVAAPEVEFFADEKPHRLHVGTYEERQSRAHNELADYRKELESVQSGSNDWSDTGSYGSFTQQGTSFNAGVARRRSRRGVYLVKDLAVIRNKSRSRLQKMHLISVKRQRRLKMKKHKYKKLQRKTRNLRRRQGKI